MQTGLSRRFILRPDRKACYYCYTLLYSFSFAQISKNIEHNFRWFNETSTQ